MQYAFIILRSLVGNEVINYCSALPPEKGEGHYYYTQKENWQNGSHKLQKITKSSGKN
jgi:hypothetical protein